MIEISWNVYLDCVGGKFSVPDGTPATEIAAMVDANVRRSIASSWAPYRSKQKTKTEEVIMTIIFAAFFVAMPIYGIWWMLVRAETRE